MAIHRKIVLVNTMVRELQATVEVLQPQVTADGLRQAHPQHLDTVGEHPLDHLQRLGLMIGDLPLGHHQRLEVMDMRLENLKDSQHNSIEGSLLLHCLWLPLVHRR